MRTWEAAGAGAFVRIVLPQARPGIVAFAILCRLFKRGQFLQGLDGLNAVGSASLAVPDHFRHPPPVRALLDPLLAVPVSIGERPFCGLARAELLHEENRHAFDAALRRGCLRGLPAGPFVASCPRRVGPCL